MLAELDVVVASVHSHMSLERTEMTEPLPRCHRKSSRQIIAHPTGRLILQRDPLDYDMERFFNAAAKYSVAMECNVYPDRLDLSDVHLLMAKQRGVKIVISTDLHKTSHLRFMKYGVQTARRGWIEKADVIRYAPTSGFLSVFGRNRGTGPKWLDLYAAALVTKKLYREWLRKRCPKAPDAASRERMQFSVKTAT